MTKTPLPPRISKKGEPPSVSETKDNLSLPELNQIVALNFRVTSALKRDIKVAAATKGITQSELLKQAFEEWKKRYG